MGVQPACLVANEDKSLSVCDPLLLLSLLFLLYFNPSHSNLTTTLISVALPLPPLPASCAVTLQAQLYAEYDFCARPKVDRTNHVQRTTSHDHTSQLLAVMTSSYASSLHHTGHPAGHHHHQPLHGRFARSSAAVTPSGMVASVIEAAPSPSPFTPPDYSLFDSSSYHQRSESRSSNYLPPLFGVPPLFAHQHQQQHQQQQAPISSARSSPATAMFASSSTAAGAAPVAPAGTSISRPSSTTLVGTTPVPPLLLNNGATMDNLLFYQGTPSDSSPESLFVQVPAKENESGVTGGHEFWVNVPWRAIINGGKLFQHREVVNELLDQIAQTPALRQRALQLLGAGHGAGYGYGAPPYTLASSSINMRSNNNDGTPFSSNGQGDFNLLTSSPWIGSNGTSSSNEEGGLFSPATAASFWNSSSSPDMNRSAGGAGAGAGPQMFGALPVSPSSSCVCRQRRCLLASAMVSLQVHWTKTDMSPFSRHSVFTQYNRTPLLHLQCLISETSQLEASTG